jgi:TonB family protein
MSRIQLSVMNFFSDPHETALRFGDFIDDLHDVFRCHAVDFGSPEDFFAFARTLKYHSELRVDVLRVVKSVMESEANISFRTILTVIAVASGGPDVTASDREMSIPVNLVIESLTGVDAYSHLNVDQLDGLNSDLTVREAAQIGAAGKSSYGDGEATRHTDLPGQANVGVTFLEKASDSSIVSIEQSPPGSANGYVGPLNDHQGLLNDYGGSNTLAESLNRLELNSLQLKIYLDSIDQRISRMEPLLENVPSLVLSVTPPSHPREEAGVRFAAAIPSEAELQLSHKDSSWSKPQGRAAAVSRVATIPLAGLPRIWTDFRQFYTFRRQSALPILIGVAVLLFAVSLFWRLRRDAGDVVVHPVNALAEGGANAGGPGVASGVEASVNGPQAGTISDPSVATVTAAQGKSSAYRYPEQAVRGAADKPTPSSKKSAQIPLRSPLRSSSSLAADADTPPVTATDKSEVSARSDRADNLSSVPLSNRLVNVSSGVMAANLVSGPKPSYPTLASLTRTQGDVVMQAVISKDGTVEELHVIKGHRLLRGAAKNAVRSWRYRPYKIDGVPVEVATIVSVDFSLHR